MSTSLIRRPSAWLPIAMSLVALSVVLSHTVASGVTREADEGTAAHIWQLLMAAQVPAASFFAVKWLPQATKQATIVSALQIGAALAALPPVFLLRL